MRLPTPHPTGDRFLIRQGSDISGTELPTNEPQFDPQLLQQFVRQARRAFQAGLVSYLNLPFLRGSDGHGMECGGVWIGARFLAGF